MTVEFDPAGGPAVPLDAATVVVLRDGPDGAEIFFVRRRADARFMGGAYVFPGGKVDAADADAAIRADLDPTECAARLGESEPSAARALYVAAVRECIEESGILFADPAPAAPTRDAIRQALAPRTAPPLAEVLAPYDLRLRLSALVPLSRWVTPRMETRRFDARFFLARAPEGAVGSHDQGETVDSVWLTAREALARARCREIVLAPPTHATLQVLSIARTVDETLALAPRSIPRVAPEVVMEGGSVCVVFPGDPSHAEPWPRLLAEGRSEPVFARRFRYDDGTWTPIAPDGTVLDDPAVRESSPPDARAR